MDTDYAMPHMAGPCKHFTSAKQRCVIQPVSHAHARGKSTNTNVTAHSGRYRANSTLNNPPIARSTSQQSSPSTPQVQNQIQIREEVLLDQTWSEPRVHTQKDTSHCDNNNNAVRLCNWRIHPRRNTNERPVATAKALDARGVLRAKRPRGRAQMSLRCRPRSSRAWVRALES
jgi:hypothetical protein